MKVVATAWLSIGVVGALSCLFIAACGGDDGRDPAPAASVGGERITVAALDRRMRAVRKLTQGSPELERRFSRGFILSQMVLAEWNRQEALARGLRVPRRVSPAQERTLVSEALSRASSAEHPITVSDAEVRRYYVTHRQEFAQPAQRIAQVIEASTRARALRAKRALRAGRTAVVVRARYGAGVPAITGDRTGLISALQGQGQFPPRLEQALFRTSAGAFGGPVRADSTWFVFRVHDASPAGAPSLSGARSRVEEQLSIRQATRNFERFLARLKGKYRSRTTCSPKLVVKECGSVDGDAEPT